MCGKRERLNGTGKPSSTVPPAWKIVFLKNEVDGIGAGVRRTTTTIIEGTTATHDNNDGQGLEEAGAPAQVCGDGTSEEVSVSSDEET